MVATRHSTIRGQRSAVQITRKVMRGDWGRSVDYDRVRFIVDETLSETLPTFERVEIIEQPTAPEERRRLTLHDARSGVYLGTAVEQHS
jgi:hypothetical protein